MKLLEIRHRLYDFYFLVINYNKVEFYLYVANRVLFHFKKNAIERTMTSINHFKSIVLLKIDRACYIS